MQPERIEETRDWLTKARQDLEAAERLLVGGPSLVEIALYHCQQTAEKALKAYLVWHDQVFPRTHDLVALLPLCVASEPSFRSLENALVTLTPYAVAFRYPSGLQAPTIAQAEEALGLAQHVLAFVLDRLPPEVTA